MLSKSLIVSSLACYVINMLKPYIRLNKKELISFVFYCETISFQYRKLRKVGLRKHDVCKRVRLSRPTLRRECNAYSGEEALYCG